MDDDDAVMVTEEDLTRHHVAQIRSALRIPPSIDEERRNASRRAARADLRHGVAATLMQQATTRIDEALQTSNVATLSLPVTAGTHDDVSPRVRSRKAREHLERLANELRSLMVDYANGVVDWERRARRAVVAGNDALAREALQDCAADC